MEEYKDIIVKSISVSSITGEGMNELKEYILNLGIQRQIEIPTSWLQLGQILNDKMKSKQTIEMNEVKNIIKSISIGDEKEINLSISVLHNIGYLLYYPSSSLLNNVVVDQDIIILDPQWLVNILKSVVTIKQTKTINNG